jgi:hypothetical protein
MPDWVNLAEPLGTIIGLVLTLMVFSYIFGDNFLFRLATHIFVGVAAGYAAVLVIYNIIFPLLANPGDELVRLGPPLILGVLAVNQNLAAAYHVWATRFWPTWWAWGSSHQRCTAGTIFPWWISLRASSPLIKCWM